MNLYGTVIRRVYGEYTITRFLGYFRACAINRYQAIPPQEGGLGSRLLINALHVDSRQFRTFARKVDGMPRMLIDHVFSTRACPRVRKV